MSAINSDFAGIDPDSLRPSLQRSRICAIRIPGESAHNPTCESAPESAGDQTVTEPTVPDSGTPLDFDNAFKPWPMEIHRVPGDDIVSTRKSCKVIDVDLQVPLSWHENYDRFLQVPISWPSPIAPLPSSATSLRQQGVHTSRMGTSNLLHHCSGHGRLSPCPLPPLSSHLHRLSRSPSVFLRVAGCLSPRDCRPRGTLGAR
jgi:hypothetical protein